MPQSLIYHRPRAKQGLCCYSRTYKPTGVLCAGTMIHAATTVVERSLPQPAGQGELLPLLPLPSAKGKQELRHGLQQWGDTSNTEHIIPQTFI